MQAALPDINTSFIKWRNKIVTSLESKNYGACLGALTCYNADLPDKYRVKISNELYQEKLKQATLLIICKECQIECDYKKVEKYEKLMPPLHQFLTSKIYERAWKCTNGHENLITLSDMIKQKIPDPLFLGIVPEPPKRGIGLIDRKEFHRKFEVWAQTMLSELEAQSSKFRNDNWKQPQDGVMFSNISGGEDLDND